MSKDDKMITRGRFKGKKITSASTERIDEFTQLSSEFMKQVFNLEPGEYLITDESDLLDFTDMASSDPDGHSNCSTYGQSNCSTPATVN
jgi:hypothetical protein